MFELKDVPPEAADAALAKAERYRLLNEPRQAESICRDVLRTRPDHQEALIMLLLALTDQFGMTPGVRLEQAQEVLGSLKGEYERAYYGGVIRERWGKAQLARDHPGHVAYGWLTGAMESYEKAEKLAGPGVVEPILRWNTCARIINGNPTLRPKAAEESVEREFSDHIPHQ